MPELERVYLSTPLEIELSSALERLLTLVAPNGIERASLEPTFVEAVTIARTVLRKAETAPEVDLSHYSEATRRWLYDQLVRLQSSLPIEPPSSLFDPDAAGLVVFHIFGRWFAAWLDADAPADWPEAQRREVVTIRPADNADGFVLHEV
jgi:hypothetical protein